MFVYENLQLSDLIREIFQSCDISQTAGDTVFQKRPTFLN